MDFGALCKQVAEKTRQRPAAVKTILQSAFKTIEAALETDGSVGAGQFGEFRRQSLGDNTTRLVVSPHKSRRLDKPDEKKG